jgi:hypothetical protein
MKNGKSRLKWTKSNAIALPFCRFLLLDEKWKKSLKMDEKLRL